MPQNRLFIPSARVGAWLTHSQAELGADELRLAGSGRRFALAEAVRVVADVTDGSDPHGVVGRVLSLEQSRAMGAEVVDSSMLLGEVAYDVVPGFVAWPVGVPPAVESAVLAAELGELDTVPEAEKSDDEMLVQYLMHKLM